MAGLIPGGETVSKGKATISKLGQTQADRFGRNPHTKVKGASTVSDSQAK